MAALFDAISGREAPTGRQDIRMLFIGARAVIASEAKQSSASASTLPSFEGDDLGGAGLLRCARNDEAPRLYFS
jgi:hypothetical protein